MGDGFGGAAEEDSLFVMSMVDGTRTFIASYRSNLFNGIVLSPDGSHVAHFSGNERVLRIARSDGTGERILARDVGGADPAFSPDGRRIAYSTSDGHSSILRVLDVESGADVFIADGIEYFAHVAASWSPDGQRLAFTRRPSDSTTLWTSNADGTDLRRLTPIDQQDTQPEWSPDGTRIVCSNGELGSDRELMVMNSDGSERRFLTDTDVIATASPRWSPDGTRILYRTYSTIYMPTVMKLVDLGSGSTRVLADDISGGPYWDLSRP